MLPFSDLKTMETAMLAKLVTAAALISTLGGCASVLKDKTQPVKVEVLDHEGNSVAGAKCDLQNDRGTFNVETPNTVFVRKSAGELVVTCKEPEHGQADGKLISRVGGAVFGNILLGGAIGAIVDSASGVAYNYPEWVKLVFGKSLTFDRNDFKDAQPTIAKAPDNASTQAAEQVADATHTQTTQPPTPEPQKVEYITIVAPPVNGEKSKQ